MMIIHVGLWCGELKRSSKVEGKREIELDFVRGVAILLVMDFHSSYPLLTKPLAFIGYPHFGWIGVDIFFVLSGFLIGGLLMKEWEERQAIDSKRFLIRRAFKLWPQYYVFIVFMILTGHLELHRSIGNLLNIQNYWPGVSHTWSLAIEEHVYLGLLLCFALASHFRLRIAWLGAYFSFVCLATIIARYVLASRGHDIFFPTQTRLDGILYGLLLAMLYHFAPDIFAKLRGSAIAWLSIAIGALTCLHSDARTSWAGAFHQDAAHIFSIAVLMFCYRPLANGARHSAAYRCVARIGLYSYGIYLWHTIFIRSVTLFGTSHPRVPGPLLGVVSMAQGIALGFLTSKCIEFPTLRLRDRLFPNRARSAVGVPAIIEANRLSS